MFIKILYIIFFALANFIIYSKLNRTGKITKIQFWLFCIVFLLFILLHIGLFNLVFLMRWKDIFPLLLLLITPLMVYFWYNYFVIKRIKRLKESNEGFLRLSIKVFSFFFLKFIYIMVFVVQCIFIFNPISSIQ
jgi:hypothetical protein